MNRFLLAVLFGLVLLCLGQSSRAQLTATGVGGGFGAGGFTPSCTPSSNFLARATSVVLTADKTNYDTLICGLNTDGVLSLLDALYIFTTVDRTTALLNLVGTSFSPATEVGYTSNFAAYSGYTGDGSTFVIDTGLVPNAGGTQFSINSASLGSYDTSTTTTASTFVPIGAANSGDDRLVMQPTNQVFCNINGGGVSLFSYFANTQGFWVCDRTSSSNVNASRNGAAGSGAAATASALDNVSITIYALHSGVGPSYSLFIPDLMTAAFIGGALTNLQVCALSNRINTYMTAYSKNVYTNTC